MPIPRGTTTPQAYEVIKLMLVDAGLIDADSDKFDGDVGELTASLRLALYDLRTTDPWGEPFALMIGTDWRSLDGTDPGDVQMRVTANAIQLRKRTSCKTAWNSASHLAETCVNCWDVQELQPSDHWNTATSRIQIRTGSSSVDVLSTRRIEVQRRFKWGAEQPETAWSDPWKLPSWSDEGSTAIHKEYDSGYSSSGTTWVDVAFDVQISDGHTFPRGILVRRATGCDTAPWTTPEFRPETHWRWKNLIPDGSLQYRCWRKPEDEKNYGGYGVELRQRAGRQPTFSVEPEWGEYSNGYEGKTYEVDGYSLKLLREPYGYRSNFRSVKGVHVTGPDVIDHEILVVDRYVRVGPALIIKASTQGGFSWRRGTFEPRARAARWSQPDRYVLSEHEWTLLSNTVRARIVHGREIGVSIEVMNEDGEEWCPDGVKSFGTTHYFDKTRVTFYIDQVAEVQYVVQTTSD
jgi:hypothetical protein